MILANQISYHLLSIFLRCFFLSNIPLNYHIFDSEWTALTLLQFVTSASYSNVAEGLNLFISCNCESILILYYQILLTSIIICAGMFFYSVLVLLISIVSVSFCCHPSLIDVPKDREIENKNEEHWKETTYQYCPPYSRKDADNFEFSMPPPKDSFKPKGILLSDVSEKIYPQIKPYLLLSIIRPSKMIIILQETTATIAMVLCTA